MSRDGRRTAAPGSVLVTLRVGRRCVATYEGNPPERSDLLEHGGSLYQVIRKRWVVSEEGAPVRVNVYLERLRGDAPVEATGE